MMLNQCVKKSQLNAQLILSIFRQPLHVSGISRPIISRHNLTYTTFDTYSFYMTVCCSGCIESSNPSIQSIQDNINLKRIISTKCCIYTVVPPDDGPRYARHLQRLTKFTKKKLCIKLVFLQTIVGGGFVHLLWIYFSASEVGFKSWFQPLISQNQPAVTPCLYLSETSCLCTGNIWAVRCLSIIVKAYIRFRVSTYELYVRGTRTGIDFSPSTSAFPFQYHSTETPTHIPLIYSPTPHDLSN